MLEHLVRINRLQGLLMSVFLLPPAVGATIVSVDVALHQQALALCCLLPCDAFLGLVTLLCLSQVFVPELQPVMQKLKPYGKPREIARQIDAELCDPDRSEIVGRRPWWWGVLGWTQRVAVTQNWVVGLAGNGAAAVHLPQLVWVHKQLIAGRNPLRPRIHTGFGCHLDDGSFHLVYTQTEADADDVLEAIVERRPEALTGFGAACVDLLAQGLQAQVDEVARRREHVRLLCPDDRERWLDERLAELDEFPRRVD